LRQYKAGVDIGKGNAEQLQSLNFTSFARIAGPLTP